MKLKRLTAAMLAFMMVIGIVSSPDYLNEITSVAADTSIALGDPSGDSKVDSKDATFILSEYSLLSTGGTSSLTPEQKEAADVKKDGKIDSKDATIVLSYYSYLSTGGKSIITDFIAESEINERVSKNSAVDKGFNVLKIPAYSGSPYVAVNNNIPFFNPSDFSAQSFEYYSALDRLGRCDVCMACIGTDLMPTEERGEIGSVKPTGWHLVRYDDIIKDKYLYNRCHLIGYQLTAENANERNLITGTRYLNVDGMLPFENKTANYIKSTSNHVLYRATPIFVGNELVCRGVLMEAYSLEDKGEGVRFNVFCYNVQPGIEIDYATGESWIAGERQTTTVSTTTRQTTTTTKRTTTTTKRSSTTTKKTSTTTRRTTPVTTTTAAPSYGTKYVANTNSHVFHYASCGSAKTMKESNKWYTNSRDELISKGYKPCSKCNP